MLTGTQDPRAIRDTFARFPSGVAALAAVVDGDPTILVASSFTVGVSQDPPLVLFAVQRSSTTWPALATAPSIGVSVLGEQHAEKVRQLACRDKTRRFDGVRTRVERSGALFLEGAPVALECTTQDVYPAGDHDIVVLRVRGVETDAGQDALVWYRSRIMTLPGEVA
ncbi:flavin reductase family protein [Promicromonospora thailandica]|uniref:NADH-FMN oxidoreductase RutF, flavin reductase (DIM6/NTAB) family n=1 Tax=Promicromonospora thailandica TaxID=765201 RepID=A0A9X2GAA3_9MICO|nr:flavin reductase family protein [Promicromonospora thailandica]MCP2266034.1 NADH-FMN oxidoreductase RutF, flavin reductase (DIM6/NTAB) family [Promicromonospora thailandica]BFF21371.1 flavin reductase family protein [Promicromonospora thailandica]